jgi:Spy/CpxP family protein refolding chaperone
MNRFVRSLAAAAAVALTVAGFSALDVGRGSVPVASAQAAPGGPGQPGQRGGRRFGEMLLSLNLNDAQKAKIRDIMAQARAKNASLPDRDAMRANMRAAFAKVQTVLNPHQLAKLKSEFAAARAQRAAQSHS